MNTRAYSPPETKRSKVPLLVLAGTLAVLGAFLPAAMSLDDGLDLTRTMYADRQAMAYLQFQAVSTGVEPAEGTVEPGGSLVLVEKSFTASEGVTVEVRRKDATSVQGDPVMGFCVRASLDDGEQTPWLCHDASRPPAVPSGDPLADVTADS